MRSVLSRASRACARGFLWGALAIGLDASAVAAPGDEPRGELTLAQAIEAALACNPDLIASRYELTAAQARIVQARLRPNPTLDLELENFAGSGDFRGTRQLESTLSLSQVIELGGKRALRESVASADRDLVSVEQRARQLDVLADVTRRYLDVITAQERVQLARQTRDLAQQTLNAIDARVQAARSPQAEASRARIALTRAILEEGQSGTLLRAARAALAATWGSIEPLFTSARADLFSFPELAPLPGLLDRIGRNPDLLRFASEARLREAELRLAQAQARPNIALALGVRHLEETNDAALVAGFSVPLRAYDRNQGVIRESQARRAQTDAARNSALIRARATLYALYQEVTAARERADALRNEAIPQAQTALDQTQAGYERGRFSFLELVTAQQDLLQVRAGVIDAAADFHRLLAELERITNEPLTRDDPEAPLP